MATGAPQARPPAGSGGRIDAIDVARGLALVAMATYHFSWDLEFFGYLAPQTSTTGPLKFYARGIASSFLFLVGVSLVLAHARGVRWRSFGRRFAMVAGAAALITLVTFLATPQSFVFFGILHHIAVASVLGLLFLRWPWWALILAAVAVQLVTPLIRSPDLAGMAFYWTGLSAIPPRSNDFVPVLPWFSAVLAGMAAARLVLGRSHTPQWLRPNGWRARGRLARLLALMGRWSLTVYLVHQPVLIALVFAFSLIVPADRSAHFIEACQISCQERFDAAACTAHCQCVDGRLRADNLLEPLMGDPARAQSDLETADIIAQCGIETGLGSGTGEQ